MFNFLQCNLEVTREAIEAISQLAMERKTGARGLRAIMVSFFHYYLRWYTA